MRAAAQRADHELKSPPAGRIPCHPRAPGEISRARRSVIAAKEAAVFIAANWVVPRSSYGSLRPFAGAGAVFVSARCRETVDENKERIVYAMDRFE